MKRQTILPFILAAFTLSLILFLVSCSKSSPVSFVGTYYGTMAYSIYHEPDTIVITSGTNSSEIIMNSRTAAGSAYMIHGTISGSTFSIAPEIVFVSSQGASYTVTGSGSLNGNSLTINYAFRSSSLITTNWTFTGTRQ